jgi:hypothetical protein
MDCTQFEVWLINSDSKVVFIVVRYNEAPILPTPSEWANIKIFKYTQGAIIEVSDFDQVAWREAINSFDSILDLEDDNVCYDLYLADNEVAISKSSLYKLDLAQDIEGTSLSTLLETTTANQEVIYTVTPLDDSGPTCVAGIPITKRAVISGPGYGTIEGVSFVTSKS